MRPEGDGKSMTGRYCPLTKEGCLGDHCGFWDTDAKECGVRSIARSLRVVKESIHNIDKHGIEVVGK